MTRLKSAVNPRLWILAVVGAVAVVALSRPPRRETHESDLRPLLLRPALARTISKSELPLLIDLYWLRVINAIGLQDSARKNRALYEYGLVLTELDPRFYHAYIHLGLNIPYQVVYEPPLPRGSYVNADLAEDIFRRGLKVFPEDMRLHIYLGWVLFGMEHKYAEAAAVYQEASKLKDAWPYMAPLATRLLAQAGRPTDAIDVARQLMDSTDDPAVKEELEQRVKELEVEAVLHEVDVAIAQFKAREHRDPVGIEDLVRAKDYSGPLEDPRGGTVYIDEKGRPMSTSLPRRLEVYE